MKYLRASMCVSLAMAVCMSAMASNSVNAQNKAAYAACRTKTSIAFTKFMKAGVCASTLKCINASLNEYGDTRNILIDAMVKCHNTQCHRAIQRYDYSSQLLKCLKQHWKK